MKTKQNKKDTPKMKWSFFFIQVNRFQAWDLPSCIVDIYACTPGEKIISPFPEGINCKQLLCQGWDFVSTCHFQFWCLVWVVLVHVLCRNNSLCEFQCASVLFCKEDTMFLELYVNCGSYILSASFLPYQILES